MAGCLNLGNLSGDGRVLGTRQVAVDFLTTGAISKPGGRQPRISRILEKPYPKAAIQTPFAATASPTALSGHAVRKALPAFAITTLLPFWWRRLASATPGRCDEKHIFRLPRHTQRQPLSLVLRADIWKHAAPSPIRVPDGTGIVTVVGELVAAGMPQHVGMRLDVQSGLGCRAARPCGSTLAPIAARHVPRQTRTGTEGFPADAGGVRASHGHSAGALLECRSWPCGCAGMRF